MELLAVVAILIVWCVIVSSEKLKPTKPPIKDIEAHTKAVMQLQPEQRKNFINRY